MEPPYIEWSEKFIVGHKGLDGEHRRFVDLINATYVAVASSQAQNVVSRLLDGIMDLAGQHFRRENAILIQINRSPIPSRVDRHSFIKVMVDAAIDKHIANHALSLPRLDSIIRDIRSEVASSQPLVGNDLKDWFVGHAIVHDAHLGPVFQAINSPTA